MKKSDLLAKMPPGYVPLIDRMRVLIEQWIGEQYGLPDLKFHDWGETLFAGALVPENMKYIAASADGEKLLLWLDEQTGRQGSLLQAYVALGLSGLLPSGEKQTAPGFVDKATEEVAASACPHCDTRFDRMKQVGQHGEGEAARTFSVCFACGGFMSVISGGYEKLEDEEFHRLPAIVREQMLKAQRLVAQVKYQADVERPREA